MTMREQSRLCVMRVNRQSHQSPMKVIPPGARERCLCKLGLPLGDRGGYFVEPRADLSERHPSWVTRSARRSFVAFLLILLMGISAVRSEDLPTTDRSTQETLLDDIQDILLLGPLEPNRLRLHIEVEGVPFRRAWRDAYDRLFDAFDTDHLGTLTPEQANRLAAVFGGGPVSAVNNTTTKSMTTLGLNREELSVLLEKVAPPLKLVQKLSGQGAGPALVPLLDINGDGNLSLDELRQAALSLHCRDFNDDQLITEQELIAGPSIADSNSSNDTPSVDGSVILLDRALDPSAVAEILLARYDRNRDGVISFKAPAEVQCLAGSLAKLDLDGDFTLTRSELLGYIALPVDVELPFVLGGGKPKQKPSAGSGYRLREKKLINGYRLQVGSMEINFGFKKGDPGQDDTRPRLRENDTDKNDYLDAAEFSRIVDAPDFALVDANRDEKISASELDTFFQNRSKAIAVQTLLDVTEQGSNFFRTLDQNADRVLTPRELLAAPKILETEDQNHDGYIGGNEMAHNLELLLMRGTPRTQRNANLVNRRVALPRVKADRTGPTWFLKLDRNRDGDVGLLEFPGNHQTFLKLDLNGDGLISADEAEAVSKTTK